VVIEIIRVTNKKQKISNQLVLKRDFFLKELCFTMLLISIRGFG